MPRSTLDTASCRDDGADGRRVQAARAARLNSLVVAASTVCSCSSDAPAAASARRAWWSARSRRVRAIGAPGGVGASPSVGLPASRAPSSSASAAKAPWAAATVSTAAARCLSDSWARHAAAQATLQSSARPRVFGRSSALACAASTREPPRHRAAAVNRSRRWTPAPARRTARAPQSAATASAAGGRSSLAQAQSTSATSRSDQRSQPRAAAAVARSRTSGASTAALAAAAAACAASRGGHGPLMRSALARSAATALSEAAWARQSCADIKFRAPHAIDAIFSP